jgi:hypothetical protein
MARLTRDFSGKPAQGARSAFQHAGKVPAWALPVMERKQAGERIGLLLVSVDEWHGGELYADKPNVARICALEDFEIERGDWSVCAGLDCLVCGDCSAERFALAAVACLCSGAASVWGEYTEGVFRLDLWRVAPYFVTTGSAIPFERFGTALAAYRETAMLLQEGFYGSAAFQPVRAALLERAGLPLIGFS